MGMDINGLFAAVVNTSAANRGPGGNAACTADTASAGKTNSIRPSRQIAASKLAGDRRNSSAAPSAVRTLSRPASAAVARTYSSMVGAISLASTCPEVPTRRAARRV